MQCLGVDKSPQPLSTFVYKYLYQCIITLAVADPWMSKRFLAVIWRVKLVVQWQRKIVQGLRLLPSCNWPWVQAWYHLWFPGVIWVHRTRSKPKAPQGVTQNSAKQKKTKQLISTPSCLLASYTGCVHPLPCIPHFSLACSTQQIVDSGKFSWGRVFSLNMLGTLNQEYLKAKLFP